MVNYIGHGRYGLANYTDEKKATSPDAIIVEETNIRVISILVN
jgi:hypothetical protein